MDNDGMMRHNFIRVLACVAKREGCLGIAWRAFVAAVPPSSSSSGLHAAFLDEIITHKKNLWGDCCKKKTEEKHVLDVLAEAGGDVVEVSRRWHQNALKKALWFLQDFSLHAAAEAKAKAEAKAEAKSEAKAETKAKAEAKAEAEAKAKAARKSKGVTVGWTFKDSIKPSLAKAQAHFLKRAEAEGHTLLPGEEVRARYSFPEAAPKHVASCGS